MANRRFLQSTIRHCCPSLLYSSTTPIRSLTTSLPSIETVTLENPSPVPCKIPNCFAQFNPPMRFSSRARSSDGDNGEEDYEDDGSDDGDDDGEEEEDELSGSEGEEEVDEEGVAAKAVENRTYSLEEKEAEAAAIGYKVIAPLDPSERAFKPWEPVFAVIQIGSHQFKVSNGDVIYAERLKFCEVNDKLLLSKVLMLGSRSQTIIGRPTLPEAAVFAVVEEHALDAKVIIFKKKRRKNYRRTKGHRQELTRLRITDIQGVMKEEKAAIAA
ncbi:hypothetical protein Scep_011314 [Stephania cephalantha]|uniref:Large ribosomal subunit protein bL21m n=1 Tax=Stephania cephalantha TaxID=152367 RepID=A0AAP0P8S5_9MAGN